MAELELKVFPAGPLFANNYLIFNKNSQKAFVVDFSGDAGDLFDFLKKEKIEVEFIALTHAHFDHIGGLEGVDIPFYLHQKDQGLLADPEKNGSAFFSEPLKIVKKPFSYQNKLLFEGRQIQVIDTPGHTPGSVSLKLNNWLFTGDTLFYQSIGRTDIPLASGELLLKSIKEKILVLPEDTLIYPGHGQSSTLAFEKKNNPFITN